MDQKKKRPNVGWVYISSNLEIFLATNEKKLNFNLNFPVVQSYVPLMALVSDFLNCVMKILSAGEMHRRSSGKSTGESHGFLRQKFLEISEGDFLD